jgi:hypothetical protein
MIQTIVSIINTGVIILNVMFPTLFKRVGEYLIYLFIARDSDIYRRKL